MRGQARAQHRDRQHAPRRQALDLREPLHHRQVGEDVGPADVEGAVDLGREVDHVGEVVQHVADGDRLDAVVDPRRRQHHRQPLGEVAQQLEARGPGPEDDRRLQDHRRDPGAEEDLADLGPRGEVLGELDPLGVDAPEVDDPTHPGVAGGLGGDQRRAPVDPGEAGLGERVDQVVEDVGALAGRAHRLGVLDVAAHHLDGVLLRPRDVLHLRGGAQHAAHRVALRHESWGEPPADVAGRTRDHASHRRIVVAGGPRRSGGAVDGTVPVPVGTGPRRSTGGATTVRIHSIRWRPAARGSHPRRSHPGASVEHHDVTRSHLGAAPSPNLLRAPVE